MSQSTQFKPYTIDQPYLLPPDMREWLPDNHLAHFIVDTVNELDLGAIYEKYDNRKGGQPAYHPRMMVTLLVYAYCIGMPSSRRIEKATYEQIPFRIVAAGYQPDHDTIADFRKRHLKALSGLFVQILRLCRKAGLVQLGHVALDGSKMKANASKHKAMSYGRMEKTAAELEKKVEELLRKAQEADDEEDRLYGKGKRGDELPDELCLKENRLKKIREAMASLEEEAKQEFEEKQEAYEEKKKQWEGKARSRRGRPPIPPSDEVDPKAQRNFTDPESRIMKDGATKSFQQSYNAQAAVDEECQVIVAAYVTQAAVDKKELIPAMGEIKENTKGKLPDEISADAGYWSETNAEAAQGLGIDLYLAPCKEAKPRHQVPPPRGRIPKDATLKDKMIRKLRTIKGRMTYAKRKKIVEPVFGQIKQVRGFRQFSFRGKDNAGHEWNLICLTHNLLKIFRHRWLLQMA